MREARASILVSGSLFSELHVHDVERAAQAERDAQRIVLVGSIGSILSHAYSEAHHHLVSAGRLPHRRHRRADVAARASLRLDGVPRAALARAQRLRGVASVRKGAGSRAARLVGAGAT